MSDGMPCDQCDQCDECGAEMENVGTATWDKSCAQCAAFMPDRLIADPMTGQATALLGECMLRGHINGCPASKMRGVPVHNILPGFNMEDPAVVFTDDRTPEANNG